MKRINKTQNNLNKVWKLLDDACGNLDNAFHMISSMVDLPDNTEKAMNQIDFSAIVALKNQIDSLMEQSE